MTPLLLLVLLSQAPGSGAALPEASPEAAPRVLMRVEVTGFALLPRGGVGEREGFVQLEPTLVHDGGEGLGLNLGAPLRLRLAGGAPGSGLVREEDWDSLSDFGQLVRAFKLGSYASRFQLRVGALEDYSLLSGHLVRGYSNQTNPDYHPAGALLTGTVGPLYLESFASDVLGARLTGAELAFDLGRALAGPAAQPGRYVVGVSAVRDWGRAEQRTPQLTLAHLDGRALLLLRPDVEVYVLGGWGGRPGTGGAWGAVAGLGADAATPTLDLRVRLEGRRQQGGFRQGFFGPAHEVARFQWTGAATTPLTVAPFPEGYSAFGAVTVAHDGDGLAELLQRRVSLALAAEVFNWGRVDVDGRLAVQLFARNVELAVRGLAVGLGEPGPRYLASGEVRWRWAGGRLYALGQGGTRLSVSPEGALRPGAFVSVGLGVDNAR